MTRTTATHSVKTTGTFQGTLRTRILAAFFGAAKPITAPLVLTVNTNGEPLLLYRLGDPSRDLLIEGALMGRAFTKFEAPTGFTCGVKAADVSPLLKGFKLDDPVDLSIQAEEAGTRMMFAMQGNTSRSISIEDPKNDPPEVAFRLDGTSIVDLKEFEKFLNGVRSSDYVTVKITPTGIDVTATGKRGAETWTQASTSIGAAQGRYDVDRLRAIAKAAKAVSAKAAVDLTDGGPLRIKVDDPDISRATYLLAARSLR